MLPSDLRPLPAQKIQILVRALVLARVLVLALVPVSVQAPMPIRVLMLVLVLLEATGDGCKQSPGVVSAVATDRHRQAPTQSHTERRRETHRDTERHRETRIDAERHRETQRDTERHGERHRETRRDSERPTTISVRNTDGDVSRATVLHIATKPVRASPSPARGSQASTSKQIWAENSKLSLQIPSRKRRLSKKRYFFHW